MKQKVDSIHTKITPELVKCGDICNARVQHCNFNISKHLRTVPTQHMCFPDEYPNISLASAGTHTDPPSIHLCLSF